MKCFNTGKCSFTQPSWSVYMYEHENIKPCLLYDYIKGKQDLKDFLRFEIFSIPGLSLRAGGRGFSPATKRVVPGYFYWKIEEK